MLTWHQYARAASNRLSTIVYEEDHGYMQTLLA